MSDERLRLLRRRLAADPEDGGAAEELRVAARRLSEADEALAFELFFALIGSGRIPAENRELAWSIEVPELPGLLVGHRLISVKPAPGGEAAVLVEAWESLPAVVRLRLWQRGQPQARALTAWCERSSWASHAFSADGRRCVLVRSPSRTTGFVIWDADLAEPQFLPTDDRIAAVAFEDGALAIARPEQGEVLRLSYPGLLAQERLAAPVALTRLVSEGGWLYGASGRGRLFAEDSGAMRPLDAGEHGPGFEGLSIARGGWRFASFGLGATLLLRAEGQPPRLLQGHEAWSIPPAPAEAGAELRRPKNRIEGAAFSPGGHVLLSGCHAGRLIAWSAVDGRELGRLDDLDPITHVDVRGNPPQISLGFATGRLWSWSL